MLLICLTEIKLLMYLFKTKAKTQPLSTLIGIPTGDEEMVVQKDKEYFTRSNSWMLQSARITEKSQVLKAKVHLPKSWAGLPLHQNASTWIGRDRSWKI